MATVCDMTEGSHDPKRVPLEGWDARMRNRKLHNICIFVNLYLTFHEELITLHVLL